MRKITKISSDGQYKTYLKEIVFLSDILSPSSYIASRLNFLLKKVSAYEKRTFKKQMI